MSAFSGKADNGRTLSLLPFEPLRSLEIGGEYAAFQCWLCHLSGSNAAGFHGSATSALAASSISDPYYREISVSRCERLRAWPRADPYLCQLSASRLDLRTGGKRRRMWHYQ